MSLMIYVLAHQAARKAVKQQLRDAGQRVSHLTAKKVSALGERYLAEHRAKLFVQIMARVQQSPALLELYQREQRKRQRQQQRAAQKTALLVRRRTI